MGKLLLPSLLSFLGYVDGSDSFELLLFVRGESSLNFLLYGESLDFFFDALSNV